MEGELEVELAPGEKEVGPGSEGKDIIIT